MHRALNALLWIALTLAIAAPLNARAQQAESDSANRQSSQIDALIDVGTTALKNGNAAEAQSKFAAALDLMPIASGDQAKRADVFLWLAQAQMSVPDLVAARDTLEKNWATLKRHPDPERLDRANYFLMSIFMQSSDYMAAEPYSRELVNRYYERHGQYHPITLDAQLNLGSVMVNVDKLKQGTELLDKTFDAIANNGAKDLYYGRLNMVATTFEASQQFDLSTRYYLRLIKDLEAEPISRTLGISYFNLAVMKKSERKLDEALLWHEKALEVLTKTAGPDDIDTIAAVSGLGNTYTVLGRPATGVQFLEQGYTRAKKVLGENHPETWMYGNNYSNALREIEKFEEARVIDQAAYDWRIKNLGPNDEATEISMLNLGLDWMGLKRFKEADQKFDELYQSRRKRLGDNHPATKEAAKFLALSQAYSPKKTSGKTFSTNEIEKLDRLTANIQAGAMEQQGKPKQALLFHRRAFEASIVENGPVDPTTLLMLRNFGLSQSEIEGPSANTIKTFEDLSRRTLEWARTEVAVTAGNARAEDIRRVANRMIYDVIRLAQDNPDAHHLLFQVLMDWKGLSTTEQSLLNQLRSKPPNNEVAKLVERIEDIQKQLRTPGQPVEQLQAELRLAEVKLAEFSASYFRSRAEAEIEPRDVVAKLKRDEVLIDYVIGDRVLPNSVDVVQEIFAFVTIANGNATVKYLGKLEELTSIISQSDYQSDPKQREKLHALLVQPILRMKSVAKAGHLYVVPDGELFLVPFEGLLDLSGKALADTFDVTLMRSATGLLQPDKQLNKDAELLLVGGPDYGIGTGEQLFPALPATLREVSTIQGLAKNRGYRTNLMTQLNATEAAVRNSVAGQDIVHMATHGFFLPKDFNAQLEPPWRGGLALFGANTATPNGKAGDDGIAYAAELSGWSFDKTELVVLSACETASGERSYVEGLRGIPAALAISGADRSLLALWGVPDEGAANFMTNFYSHLLTEGMSYESAYRATKRDAMAGKVAGAETADVWQAFVMVRN